ncbi:MAG: choice-of-anchor tandem repeat GloVer-containing protein [Terriglobales bacterium]
MQSNKSQVFKFAVLTIVVACLAAAIPAHAAGRDKLLYRFAGPDEQVTSPGGMLTADAAGNFYGVESYQGTVFELLKGANGTWSDKVLYNFTGGSDGRYPNPGFIFDAAGNMYGVANQGGDYNVGTVWELSPQPDGTWTETTLYSFNNNNGTDGIYPGSGLIADAAGNLYGGTMFGGNYQDPYCAAGCGAIFKMTHNPDGTWTESTLYGLLYIDGYEIFSNLNFDAAGNLYGMATWGGTGFCLQDGDNDGCGTIFQLAAQPDGSWMFHRLYSFQGGTDGSDPIRTGSMVFDSKGNLYGTTATGGNTGCSNRYWTGCGTVFEFSPQGNGQWAEQVLYVFPTGGPGVGGASVLNIDAKGNLFSITAGGTYGYGVFYKLSDHKGVWTYDVLYNFDSYNGDILGMGPLTPFDGYLYGLGRLGGAYGGFGQIKLP